MKFFEKNTNILTLASFLLFLSVALGAFGTHVFKEILTDKMMETYKTGVHYHQIHGLVLLMIGLSKIWSPLLKWATFFFALGILLFSGLCYLYAVTGIKIFAMIVPIGGLSFLMGHAIIFIKALNYNRK